MQQPDVKPGNYYVSVRDGKRSAFLLGPYENDHATALTMVNAAAQLAYELDPKAAFYAFGTARVDLDEEASPGRLNKYFDPTLTHRTS